MPRFLHIEPALPVPIWSQIEEGVRRLVAAGLLRPGQPVPSVRDLARELRINPATASKAYQRLTEQGVLEVRRGDGTFVANSPPAMSRPERSRILGEAATQYASVGRTLGATKDEAIERVRGSWAELGQRGKGAGR